MLLISKMLSSGLVMVLGTQNQTEIWVEHNLSEHFFNIFTIHDDFFKAPQRKFCMLFYFKK